MIDKSALAFCAVLAGCQAASADRPAAYQGTVELDEWVLSFEVPGKVREVTAVRGSPVKAGERLASLDSTIGSTVKEARESEARAAESQLALVRAGTRAEDLRSMEAQIRAARAAEDLLRKNLTREKELLARGASTDAAVEDLSGRLDRAIAERQALEQKLAGLRRGSRTEEVTAAEARAAAAGEAVKLEEQRLERHELTAPATGVILDVHSKVGEVVAVATPIVTVGDVTHPFVDVFVPEPEVAKVTVGEAAEVRVDGEPSPFSGAVETIARKTEFTPRYLFSDRERPNLVVRVRIRIADPGQKLHPGVPAFATLHPGAK